MPEHDCGTCGVPGEWQCIRCPRRTSPVIELTGPSLIQTAPVPECPTHGRMHPDLSAARYVCHGWDGEGCPHVVALDDMAWTPAGTIPLSDKAAQRLWDMMNGHDG